MGRKTYAAFSRRGRSGQIVEGLGCQNPPESKCKKSSHGATEKVTKIIMFEANIGPKMDPGGLRKRVRTTVGPPSQGVPGAALGSILGALGAHFGPPFGNRC